MTKRSIQSLVVVHMRVGDTCPDIYIVGGEEVAVIQIDDNAPDDRCYEHLARDDFLDVVEIVGENEPIGHAYDDGGSGAQPPFAPIEKIGDVLNGKSAQD